MIVYVAGPLRATDAGGFPSLYRMATCIADEPTTRFGWVDGEGGP
jgi:hypothetical protein